MRRAVFILIFLFFSAGVVWYALAYVSVPKMTFAEAAEVNDSKKKVMIIGKVLTEGLSTPHDGAISFTMVDGSGSEISIAGQSHGDYFHASSIFFPAN
jgi:hypothetical protein